MTVTDPAVSVIVPVRNAASTLDLQLRALLDQQVDVAYEVIAVDDASDDASAALLAGWAAADDRVTMLRGTGGGSYASRMIGAEAAAGRHLLFCDADDMVSPGWIGAAHAALGRWPLVGGPLELGLLNSPRARTWRFGDPSADIGALSQVLGFLPFTLAANLGVRREVFWSIGGFRRGVRNGEDVGFCWRAQLAGHRLGFEAAAVVHYRLRPTFRGHLVQHYRYGRSIRHQVAQHTAAGARAPSAAHNAAAVAGHAAYAVASLARGATGQAGHRLGRAALAAGMVSGRLRRSRKAVGSLDERAARLAMLRPVPPDRVPAAVSAARDR